MKCVAGLLTILGLTLAVYGENALPEGGEGRIGPYFVVESEEGVEAFPLLKTEAKVNIAGVVANVHLTQVYKNSGSKTIEAVYVFPLGTRSAIHAMNMQIADRTIEAEIQEKEKAQQIYNAAKEEGKVASLLEQERPNVFTMNVANIMPGDVVNVTVEYTELLVPEEGTYEYVFPTVVGPRFTGESSQEALEGKDNWVETPYTKEGEAPSYAFNIKVALDTGIPITKLDVPSHQVNITKQGDEATVTLAPEERKAGNKDFILRYSLQGDAIQSGLVLYPGKEANYFLLMAEPPAVTKPEMIPPREYVFIVDVSGSMHGFPLDTSKTLIRQIIRGLRKEDYFNILFFAGGSKALSEEPLPATGENIKKALAMLDEQRGGGGTRILDALRKASKLEKREGLSRTFIAATDGYVSVEKEAFDVIRDGMGGANFFAFGIGSSVNRYLIEGMAHAGNGRPFVVTNGEEAEATAARFVEYVRTPLLTDVNVAFDGFDAYDVEPPSLPDLFSERPLILFGKYKKAVGTITVTGNTAQGRYERTFRVSPELESADNVALRYLWARKRLELLSDYAQVGVNNRDEIVEIGLAYHLMTAYTSFVAVDTVVRDTGETVTVKQPLPLPEGVSSLAVGRAGMSRGLYAARAPMPASAKGKAGNFAALTFARPEVADEEAGKRETGEIRQKAPAISLIGGTVPKGFTLKEAETALIKQLGEKLEAKFKLWELSKLTVDLEVKSGKVTKVTVVSSKGKTLDEEALAKIFKELSLDADITGTVTVILVYL